MSTLAVPKTRKLPVWRTVGDCYATVARNLGQLVHMSWLWLLIALPTSAGLHWLEWTWGERALVPGFLVLILEMLVLASIAVAWHRLVLRQERVTAPAYLRLDWTVCFYALYGMLLVVGLMLLTAALTLPMVVVSLLLFEIARPAGLAVWQTLGLSSDPDEVTMLLVMLVLWPPVFLVLPRIFLVLPAIALGERLTLSQPGAARERTRCGWGW